MTLPVLASTTIARVHIHGDTLSSGLTPGVAKVWGRMVDGFAVMENGGYACVGEWLGVHSSSVPTVTHVIGKPARLSADGVTLICVSLDPDPQLAIAGRGYSNLKSFRVTFILSGARFAKTPVHTKVEISETRNAASPVSPTQSPAPPDNVMTIDIETERKILFIVHDEIATPGMYVNAPNSFAGKNALIQVAFDYYTSLGISAFGGITIGTFVSKCRNSVYLGTAMAIMVRGKEGTIDPKKAVVANRPDEKEKDNRLQREKTI